MPSKNQMTAARGVRHVAAELARNRLVASLMSRRERGAGILVTDAKCTKAFSAQARADAALFSCRLLNELDKVMASSEQTPCLSRTDWRYSER